LSCIDDSFSLTNCILTNCTLTNCILTNCILTNCILKNCILTNCTLMNCILYTDEFYTDELYIDQLHTEKLYRLKCIDTSELYESDNCANRCTHHNLTNSPEWIRKTRIIFKWHEMGRSLVTDFILTRIDVLIRLLLICHSCGTERNGELLSLKCQT
jgi:hypothetical protein